MWPRKQGMALGLVVIPVVLGNDPIVGVMSSSVGVERFVRASEVKAYEKYNEGVATGSVAALREALGIKRDFPEALINLGNLVPDKIDAIQLYEEALGWAEDNATKAQALSNLGYTWHLRGSWDAARDSFEAALALAPSFVDAHFNFGNFLRDLGDGERAAMEYRETLRWAPTHELARLNLANIFFDKGDITTAATLQRNLADDGNVSRGTRVKSLNNLGQTYRDAGDHRSARNTFARALAMDPTDTGSLANLVTTHRALCDWRHTFPVVDSSIMPYDAIMQADATPSLLRDVAIKALARYPTNAENWTSPPPPHEEQQQQQQQGKGKIRVGYVSYDFREHPMGYLTRQLVSGHDLRRTTLLSYGPDDGSALRRLAESAPDFVDLENVTVGVVAAKSRGLDVVVDLMAHTRGAKLQIVRAMRSGVRIVCNYLGYPGTGGGGFYDYTIADKIVAPPEFAGTSFAEKLILLPGTYQANDYENDEDYDDDQQDDDVVWLCNLNNVDKFEPEAWTAWMNGLRFAPTAKLALLKPKNPLFDAVRATLWSEAAARGIDANRIEWWPRVSKAKHVLRLKKCACFVDNFVYGAHTTAADALWAGTPLVTLRGYGAGSVGRFSSRVGVSLLAASDLELTAVDTVAQFEDLVASVAQNPTLRWALRRHVIASTLRGRTFDAIGKLRDLERAYAAALEVNRQFHVVVVTSRTKTSMRNRLVERALTNLSGTERLVAAFPGDADAQHLRGLALHFKGDSRGALVHLRRACALSGPAHFWKNLAVVAASANGGTLSMAASLTAARLSSEPIHHHHHQKDLGGLFAAAVLSREQQYDPELRLRLGAALDDAGDGDGAMDEWTTAVPKRHAAKDITDEMTAARNDAVARRSSTVVAIYCDEYGQTWWPGWGPSSMRTGGLGGSEEAVVYLSRELVKFNWTVEVYAEPQDLGPDEFGVTWLHHATFDPTGVAVFVAWRYHISAFLSGEALRYVWLQDVVATQSWTSDFVASLSGIFALSDFHARTLPRAVLDVPNVVFRTPNGIAPDDLYDVRHNNNNIFAYGSAPNRGLAELLRVVWPRIFAELNGTATLDVYYGFSPAFVKWGTANIENFPEWRADVEQLLRQPGVKYHGMVDHETLAKGYARAGFLLYPTTYPETGCVTVMKAMAAGAIPITSRNKDSVVPELTGKFDLGPEMPRTAPVTASLQRSDDDHQWLNAFADAAIAAHRADLDRHRRDMVSHARSTFLWANVARLWDRHFTDHLQRAASSP